MKITAVLCQHGYFSKNFFLNFKIGRTRSYEFREHYKLGQNKSEMAETDKKNHT